jgi:hypothetical protein
MTNIHASFLDKQTKMRSSDYVLPDRQGGPVIVLLSSIFHPNAARSLAKAYKLPMDKEIKN